MQSNRLRNISFFALLALVWGTSYPAIEIGLQSLPPILFAALRYDLASVALFGYVLATGATRWRPATRAEWQLVAIGGTLLIGVHYALLFVGQSYVPSAIGAVMMSFVPVLTPALAVPLLKKRLSPPEVGGLAIGLIGVVIVANPGEGFGGRLLGVGLLFVSAVSFAFGSVLTARFDVSLPLPAMQAWMTLIGAGVLHLSSAAYERSAFSVLAARPGLEVLIALSYLALFASAGGFLLYFDLLSELGPSEVSLVSYLVPVVAAASGWLAFGETISSASTIGFCVIFVGFALLELRPLHDLLVRRRRHALARRYAGPSTVAVAGNRYYK